MPAPYNLPDEQAEFELCDRLSFMRFVGLGLADAVPDAKTMWPYRKALNKAGGGQKLGDVLDLANTASGVWADSAYRAA